MEKQSKESTKKNKVSKKNTHTRKKKSNLDIEEIKENNNSSKSMFGLSEVIGLVLITMLVSVGISFVVTYTVLNKKYNNPKDRYANEIVKQYNYIIDNYYDKLDNQKLVDGAIKGMIDTLGDEHSIFIDEEKNDNFDKTLEGSYEGAGIEVYNKDGSIIVLRCFAGSPAYEAGIRANDKIIAFNDIDLKEKATTELSSMIAEYPSNKKFTLTYERDGKQTKVSLKKKYLVIPSVTSKTYNKNNKKVGYIAVSQFSATTYNQFKKALAKLEKQNIDSLIIDLRDNSGGHLSVVDDMLSLFMDKKHVIYQIQSKDNIKKYYSSGKVNKTYPIVILQNEISASASELMSSALQEQLNATVVGTVSYGKGTVQELINLKDGNEYKFTTKKWLTSKGKWINDKGVEPAVKVELDQKYHETYDEKDDNQLQRALEEAIK